MPYLSDVNKFTPIVAMAYNSDIDAAWEDVHSLGGAIGFLAGTGEHIHAVSDSIEDDPDKGAGVPGTGAHSIKVFYINTSGALTSETIALNGAAAVISVATDVAFVIGAYVVDAGTGLAAVGQILIKNAAETVNLMEIAATQAQTFMGAFKVPTGYRLDIVAIDAASCILATGAESLSYLRFLISNWNQTAGDLTTVDSEHFLFSVSGSRHIDLVQPLQIPADKIVRLQAKGAAANNYVQANVEAFLVKV
jgi:hypothetical protein